MTIIDIFTNKEVLKLTLLAFIKLMVMSYLFFYKIPQYIFPQKDMKDLLDRIVYNFLYMTASILAIVPLLIFLKIFSYVTLFLSFLFLKAFMVYYFDKQNYFNLIKVQATEFFVKVFDWLDNLYVYLRYGKSHRSEKRLINVGELSYFHILKKFFIIFLFVYAIFYINLNNFLSLSNKTSDVAQFIEWLGYLNKNLLYYTHKTAGPDFYGTAIFIFFLQKITNIDSVIIFSVHPTIIILITLLSIYYFLYKLTDSHYCAIFAIIFYVFYIISPIGQYLYGLLMIETSKPPVVDIFNLKFYFSTVSNVPNYARLDNINYNPFGSLNAGLPYAFSTSFFLFNLYFLIKSFYNKDNHNILLYALTIFIIFSIHAGQAFILIPCSLLILFNAIFFKHIDFQLVKKGIMAIFIPAILGSAWLLSILKYGMPQGVGKAAPIIDKIFNLQGQRINFMLKRELNDIVVFYKIGIFLTILMLLLYPLSLVFEKKNKKFLISSASLIFIGVAIIYLDQNLGIGNFVSQARSVNYYCLALTIGGGLYFYFFEKFLKKFINRIYEKIMTYSLLCFFILSVILTPSWIGTKKFFTTLNSIQYNAIALEVYKIKKLKRPFSWTIVSFVQTYPKVLGKGYHMNISTFLKKYNPYDKYLKIPTEYIYIFVQNIPQSYGGSGEWYYRWRKEMEDELKVWITQYSQSHNNIKIFDDKKFFTVYEIDNRNYMKYLYERKNKK